MAGLLDYPKPQTANPVAAALNTMGASLTPSGDTPDVPTPTVPTQPNFSAPPPSGAPDKDSPLPLPNPTPAPAPVPAPDNRTVEQRLNGILDLNSDYIKRARNEGMQVANRRGLVNSSIAAGAAQGAAIDRALPIAQQDADIAAQGNRLGLSIQAEKDRLAQAAGYDMERLQTDAANNLIRDAAQAKSGQDLAKVQGQIQSALQSQGNTEQMQRMGLDLSNQLQLQDKQLAGDLAKITASGNEDIRRLVEAGNQERITLQQSIAAQDRQAMASSMVNIFQIEQQLRAALLSNDKISATERAAYEQTITALGQPIRDFMNKLFGPQGANGTSFPASVSGAAPSNGGDVGGGSGGVGDNLGTTGIVGLPGGSGLGGGGGDLGTFGQDSAWLPFTPEANNSGVPSIDNPLPGLGGYGNNGLLSDEQRRLLGGMG